MKNLNIKSLLFTFILHFSIIAVFFAFAITSNLITNFQAENSINIKIVSIKNLKQNSKISYNKKKIKEENLLNNKTKSSASNEKNLKTLDEEFLFNTAAAFNQNSLEVIFNESLLSIKYPAYPKTAIVKKLQGEVLLRILCLGTQIQQVIVYKSSGYKILDNAASAAAKHWQITQPIAKPTWIQVKVVFSLK
ncbi:MAG: energy transducer TonB [Alphaproteobacteria bacterium]|nr:energy transducer TonB [Alphaproteobacteria bacterium]